MDVHDLISFFLVVFILALLYYDATGKKIKL